VNGLPDQQNQGRSGWVVFGFCALFLFQLFSTLMCFKTPAELFRPEPIVNIDWCSQYYWSYAARQFFHGAHRLWGFDPYYMAGYPLDFVFNSSLPVQVSNIFFRFLPIGLVIKWFFFLTFLAAPFNFYLASRNFGLERGASLGAAALGVSYFWLGEDALFGNWGMLSGSFLLNFSLLAVSCFYRYLKQVGRMTFLFFTITLALSVLIHKTFVVLIGLPFAVLVLIFLGRLNSKTWLGIIGAGVFSYLVNSFYLMPLIRFLPNKIEDPNTTFFQNTQPLQFLADLFPAIFPAGVPIGRILILLFAVYGIFQLKKNRQARDLFLFSAIGFAGYFVFVYFGSFIGILRNLQPYRYLTALFFMLTPAAGFGLSKIRERFAPKSKTIPVIFAGLLLALQFVPSFRLFYMVSPLSSVWPGKVLSLKAWLEKNTDQSGRIMMEDINKWEGKLAPYGSSRFVGLVPALMPRYLVGGPLPNAFIRHHYVSFHDGLFLNKPISGYADPELAEKMKLYNIRWAVAWSRDAKDRLEKFPPARLAARFEDLEVFEIGIEPGWFLAGTGALKADYDRIELSNLQPQNNIVVLKMHWLDGFKARPKCEIFRYDAGGDPIGFLGLKNPAPEVLLEYER
jgi:hypothetical protein